MKCIICGEEFEPRHNGGKPQIVCSKECLYERKKQLQNQNYKEIKKERNRIARMKKRLEEQRLNKDYMSLDDAQKAAADMGVSYGQYEAMKWMEKVGNGN